MFLFRHMISLYININASCIVNVKPAGLLTVRRKLSGAPGGKPVSIENASVQFPNNLRTRHPLIGVIRERKRRSKKRDSHNLYEKL